MDICVPLTGCVFGRRDAFTSTEASAPISVLGAPIPPTHRARYQEKPSASAPETDGVAHR
jgi:hypothetical protein